MATATYVPLATQTLGSATSSITFSSIPGGYTDLRLTFTCTTTSAGAPQIQFNGVSTNTYSSTYLWNNSSTPASSSITNYSAIIFSSNTTVTSTTIPTSYFLDIFSYAGSTNKTVLGQSSTDLNGSGQVIAYVGLWRNTGAITSLSINGLTFNAGTTATLWGI